MVAHEQYINALTTVQVLAETSVHNNLLQRFNKFENKNFASINVSTIENEKL